MIKFIKREDFTVQVLLDSNNQNSLKTVSFPSREQAHLYEFIICGHVAPRDNEFARGLCTARNPSPNQMVWVSKLITQTLAALGLQVAHTAMGQVPGSLPIIQPYTPSEAYRVDLSKVMRMYNHASTHLKKPKITLMLKSGEHIRFSYYPAKNRIFMNRKDWGGYGWINVLTGAVIFRGHGPMYEDQIKELLTTFCAEPEKTVILHAKLTGHCCFCSLPLSDPRSLHHGYGEVCAEHWHLPWGDKSNYSAEGEWVLNLTT